MQETELDHRFRNPLGHDQIENKTAGREGIAPHKVLSVDQFRHVKDVLTHCVGANYEEYRHVCRNVCFAQ